MHLYSDVTTQMGKLRVACNSKGITMIASAKGSSAAFMETCRKRLGSLPQKGSIPKTFSLAVKKAAAGQAFNPIPLDLSHLSDFQRRVLRILRQVPRGSVRTYGWLARKAGRPGAARAVGNIMAKNPIPFLVPCHRVVPASGGVGKYGWGSSLKRKLLQTEGVDVDRL